MGPSLGMSAAGFTFRRRESASFSGSGMWILFPGFGMSNMISFPPCRGYYLSKHRAAYNDMLEMVVLWGLGNSNHSRI